MINYQRKPRSFLYSFKWVGFMLIGLGAVFLIVAIANQFIPFSPESVVVYHNGVEQPQTYETLQRFRWTFLLIFGITACALFAVGGILFYRKSIKQKNELRLKREGVHLSADFAGYITSHIQVNNRIVDRLQCSYTDNMGRTYLFKSGLLRMDPSAYLRDGKVSVYHERGNISNYFVDIDGSVGVGETLFEL